MKLTNLTNNRTKTNRFKKIFERRFGTKVNFNKLDVQTAIKIVNKLDESIAKMRNSHGIHTAEKNRGYMESLLLKEGIDTWLQSRLGIAHKRKLTEGEIEQAEAVLAAKDFVDRLQKMLEDVGRIINEDLPPLTDVIRDQIGQEQADGYAGTASQALSAVQTALSQSRGEMDGAARILSGEQPPQTAMDMPGDEMNMDVEPEMDMPNDEMGGEEMPADDNFGATDAEVGGGEDMGRELR